MSEIAIRFVCGHAASIAATAAAAPVCVCGETRVQAVQARAPRFRGACSGPYAEMVHLDPIAVDVAPQGPLRLKPPEEEEH